jgi:hypothetical protein
MIAIVIVLNPNISDLALERAVECLNGGWRFVYDAGPLGYAGLKVECICNDLGETLAEFYRVAGRVFFSIESAMYAWMGCFDVSNLRTGNEGTSAAEGPENSDRRSRQADSSGARPARAAA